MQKVDFFIESIRSEATRESYKQSFKQFEEDMGFKLTEKTNGKG